MITISCRGPRTMPDGSVEYLDIDKFSMQMTYKYDGRWSIIPPMTSTSKHKAFIFGGYNNHVNGWDDAALDAARAISTFIPTLEPHACLWPGMGSNLLETIDFHVARENAVVSATHFYGEYIQRSLDLGYRVVLIGHSAGCWLIHNLLEQLQSPVDLVVFMEAAVRCSEVSPGALGNAHKILNFHSSDDSALRTMQHDFVDEAGGWSKLISAVFGKKPIFESNEKILGMHGYEASNITNIDLTQVIGARHSDGRHLQSTWDLVNLAAGKS